VNGGPEKGMARRSWTPHTFHTWKVAWHNAPAAVMPSSWSRRDFLQRALAAPVLPGVAVPQTTIADLQKAELVKLSAKLLSRAGHSQGGSQ
jgi:hypothetical protein